MIMHAQISIACHECGRIDGDISVEKGLQPCMVYTEIVSLNTVSASG